MNSRPLLALLTLLSFVLGVGPARAQINVSGEANFRALLDLAQQQIDSGKELSPEQQSNFEQARTLVDDSGLERARLIVTGEMTDPEVAVGLIGDPEKLKAALNDPESPLAEALQRDPEGGPNDYILTIPEEVDAAAGELPKTIELSMTEGTGMLYFAPRGEDGEAIFEDKASTSILPGSHERMWSLQSAMPKDVKASIMSGIQKIMAAGQASGNPQIGQAMMMMGMAMPIIDDVSRALAGIDTLALGFMIAPDGKQVLDFAQRRREPDTAATLQSGLADGSYQPQGIASVLHAMTVAPGVETRHLQQEDILFSRMKWAPEANEGIGEALTGSGMLYFQQIMGGAGAAGEPGAGFPLPGN